MRQIFRARFLPEAVCAAALIFFSSATLRAQTPPASPAPAPVTREVTDEIGRTIRIPQPVRRIVSLAPSMTETVYALGLQDLLVGDTDYCDYPPEAKLKTKVGGTINPSLEVIAALHPDLVLVTAVNRMDTVHALATLGIPSYGNDPHTVDQIISSSRRLGEVLGAPEAGAELAKDLDQRLADLHRRVGSLAPRRVLFVVWTEPLISIGKDTFIADALQHAGAVSIVDSSQSWPEVNLEEVVRLQPEYLVFAESHSQTNLDTLSDVPGWRILDAVKNRHVAVLSEAINRPGPRIVSVIEDLARQLHPEAFADKPDKTESPSAPHASLVSAEPEPLVTTVTPSSAQISPSQGALCVR